MAQSSATGKISTTTTKMTTKAFSFECRCYPPDFIGDNLFRAHVAKSMYAIQLERWFTLFGRENIKV